VILPTLNIEKRLWSQGYSYIAGIDEVGRGAWAGPVVAAAVVFPKNAKIPKGLRDSKLLTPKRREELNEKIKEIALGFAVGEIFAIKVKALLSARKSNFVDNMARALALDPRSVPREHQQAQGAVLGGGLDAEYGQIMELMSRLGLNLETDNYKKAMAALLTEVPDLEKAPQFLALKRGLLGVRGVLNVVGAIGGKKR